MTTIESRGRDPAFRAPPRRLPMPFASPVLLGLPTLAPHATASAGTRRTASITILVTTSAAGRVHAQRACPRHRQEQQ